MINTAVPLKAADIASVLNFCLAMIRIMVPPAVGGLSSLLGRLFKAIILQYNGLYAY
jgi:hypothetical protein